LWLNKAYYDGTLGDEDIHATTFTPITPVQPLSVLNTSLA
jgi:hypothetical protein